MIRALGPILPAAEFDLRRMPRNFVPVALIPQDMGTPIGSMASYGGLAAAFDGNTNQAQTACAAIVTSINGYGNTVGKSWGRPVSIFCARMISPNGNSFMGGSTAGNFKIQGSNDGSSWVDLSPAVPFSIMTASAESIVIATAFNAYLFHQVNLSGNGSSTGAIAELYFYGGY